MTKPSPSQQRQWLADGSTNNLPFPHLQMNWNSQPSLCPTLQVRAPGNFSTCALAPIPLCRDLTLFITFICPWPYFLNSGMTPLVVSFLPCSVPQLSCHLPTGGKLLWKRSPGWRGRETERDRETFLATSHLIRWRFPVLPSALSTLFLSHFGQSELS